MNYDRALTTVGSGTPIRYTSEQLSLIRRQRAPLLDDEQFEAYVLMAARTGLDISTNPPQLYAIPRKRREKVGNDWVDVIEVTYQTGIDGYRLLAKRGGIVGAVKVTYCGKDDPAWREVWLSDEPPAAAKATIYHEGEPFDHVVLYKEYAQMVDEYTGEGQNRRKTGKKVPNSMWASMPVNQLGKCAEAGLLRKLAPVDAQGVFVDAEEAGLDYIVSVENQRAESREAKANRQIQAPKSRSGRAATQAAPEEWEQPHAHPFDDDQERASEAQNVTPPAGDDAAFDDFFTDLNNKLYPDRDLKDVGTALQITATPAGLKDWWKANLNKGNLVAYIMRKLDA